MICTDEELSAYDAAMALFYRYRPSKPSPFSIKQRDWLKKRNACADRDCVLELYSDLISSSADEATLPWTHERRTPKPDGSDLMLGTLQSPTGEVNVLGDTGSLYIRRLGGDWYAFSAFAVHLYDPHDGRGANESDSSAAGVVRLPAGRGVWSNGNEGGCGVEFRQISKRVWELEENGVCSGIGSTLSGTYYLSR